MAWSRAKKKLLLATPSRKKKFRLSKRNGIAVLAGGEIGANTQLNTPAATNLLFQNKRKCNFKSYDTNHFGLDIILYFEHKKGNKLHIYFVLFIKY
jgi:hypothetical protein